MISSNYKFIYSKLPHEVKRILILSEGWLIGGSIMNIFEGVPVKDYDIIITDPEKLQLLFNSVIPENLAINSHGGFKLTFKDDLLVDLWIDRIENICERSRYLFNMSKAVLFESK